MDSASFDRVLRITFQRWSALALMAVGSFSIAHAQTADTASGAFSVFRECVDAIHDNAYKQETKAVIITKALHGLVKVLGANYANQDQDLSSAPDEDAEKTFEQTVQAISEAPGQRRSLRELVETAVDAYCRQHDPYTRYVRSEDFHLVQLMNKNTGSGVGMTVNDRNGQHFCYPLPGSPAEASGIKSGDKLLSVDGKTLEEKPLEYVAGLIKGAPGTDVMLRVERSFGRAQTIKVVRESFNTPAILVEKKLTGQVLRVRKFNKDLLPQVREAVAGMSPSASLTLDFRGCPGGNLDVSIDFANLFMEPGETIVTLRSRGKADEVHVAKNAREIKAPSIILLQDEGTASAAELVIAALISSQSNRAASQGSKTYGKGVFQNSLTLRGGGLLILTTGEIIAPQGRTWEGIGLLPSLENRGRIFPKDE